MAQEVMIAAINERGGGSDKGDDGGAQGRCLPRLGPNALLSVDRDGNLAIGRVSRVSVCGLHHQAEASALIRRDPGVPPRRFRGQHVPEPENGLEPVRQIVIKWQDDRRLGIRAGVGEDQILNAIPGAAGTICPLRTMEGVMRFDG